MPTPSELRDRAETLRDVARTMRTKAPLLDDDTSGVLTHYPHARDGVWWGSAATEFYDQVTQARGRLRTAAEDVVDYAGRCETRAEELDDEADRLELEQAGQ
ncbi:hypothetical protein [Serinicoccus profundi]|uniref:hypothetical protein n=1 Tax=Serinicoccus profundi TaxID=1078471 RepID=UPI000255F771|nr:hypothetical protein [Serinicoccus profundi]